MYFIIKAVKCRICGKMVEGFYGQGKEWWNEFLLPGEDIVCSNCMGDRPGFKEKFKEVVGLTFEEANNLK